MLGIDSWALLGLDSDCYSLIEMDCLGKAAAASYAIIKPALRLSSDVSRRHIDCHIARTVSPIGSSSSQEIVAIVLLNSGTILRFDFKSLC